MIAIGRPAICQIRPQPRTNSWSKLLRCKMGPTLTSARWLVQISRLRSIRKCRMATQGAAGDCSTIFERVEMESSMDSLMIWLVSYDQGVMREFIRNYIVVWVTRDRMTLRGLKTVEKTPVSVGSGLKAEYNWALELLHVCVRISITSWIADKITFCIIVFDTSLITFFSHNSNLFWSAIAFKSHLKCKSKI